MRAPESQKLKVQAIGTPTLRKKRRMGHPALAEGIVQMADCSQLWAQFVKLANEMETTRVSLLNSCSETISGMMHGAFPAPNQRGAALN